MQTNPTDANGDAPAASPQAAGSPVTDKTPSMLRTNTSLSALGELFRSQESFVVLSHYRPDGDALGSSLAIGLALKNLGKRVTILNQDPVPETLAFLPGAELIRQPDGPVDAEIVIAVDCATRERLGESCIAAAAHATRWVNIDHHRSNEDYGDLFYVDYRSPATGQILFDLLETAGLPLDREIGDNLYVAISTDTGSFQYEGTTARTYQIASQLMELGVNISDLARKTYESYPLRRIQLLRGLLNVMKITHGGKVASWALRRSLMDEVGARPEDAEGLIDTLRAIEGVVVALYFEEMGEGRIRVSLRSKDRRVDVGKVAALFGGGGHPLAAGTRIRGTLEDAEHKLFTAIDEALSAAAPAGTN